MFKYLLGIALLISVCVCATSEIVSRRRLDATEAGIARSRAEIRPMLPVVREVMAYQKMKDQLQERIDRINQLKQNQKRPAAAVEKVMALDGRDIESIAITETNTLVINRVKR